MVDVLKSNLGKNQVHYHLYELGVIEDIGIEGKLMDLIASRLMNKDAQ